MTIAYYLPDSRDAVDWTYDFDNDRRDPDRNTRDDLYCHEVLSPVPYDGMLVSYAAIKAGRYAAPARRRLFREGLRAFFRAPEHVKFMGDCGAFTYAKQDVPPYSVDEVAEFYAQVGVDFGLAVDHIVPGYDVEPTDDMRRRYALTLELAADFRRAAKPYSFTPVAVVQGWSPETYANAATELQRQGYRYLAIGGLVRLRNAQLLDVLRAVAAVRRPDTRLHLLGVARPGLAKDFAAHGVASFDSTSPLRRAWMDARANYLLGDQWYAALRIPASDSPRVCKRIAAGEIDGDKLRALEQRALERVAAYAHGDASHVSTLDALLRYSELHSPDDKRRDDYVRTLTDRPWERCSCAVCSRLGHHVIIFRGAERNRCRGFHNIGQFYASFQAELAEVLAA